ncbi:cell adhesion molecule CEACAM5-like [Chaetodon auriga]|uniref:cell adhesion molecule CEACAM5-like n=1 Tax=Chaetodon auriga TaxID=39042 RepID=UPI004032F060
MFQSHRDMRGAAMSLTTAAGGFLVLLLTGTVVQGHSGWEVSCTPPQIYASRGSTVQIHCTYRHPPTVNTVVEKYWFIRRIDYDYVDLKTEPEYLGRVKYDCHQNSCTLTITDLKDSDSAEYTFRFITDQPDGKYTGSPGVTLTIADLQVQVVRFQVRESFNWVQMTCLSSYRLPGHLHYAWYKNGRKIREQTSDSYSVNVVSADNYSCAVDGYEASRSPPVYAPQSLSVSVSPSGDIMEGSSVTLSCSSDANPAANYTWYKENVNVKALSEEAQLVFRSIQSSDSGEYYCAAENELGRRTSQHISIDVKYAPKPPSVSVSPSGETGEGSSVTLSCSSDANPAANYTWYKENEDSPKASGQNFTITDFRAEHSGNYYCEAQNKRGRHNSTLYLFVVAGKSSPIMNIIRLTLVVLMVIPILLVSLWMRKKKTQSSTTEPHERVEMIEVDPCDEYENISEQQADTACSNGSLCVSKSLCKESQLVFRSIQSSDSGEYYCAAENSLGRTKSGYVSINLNYALNVPSVSVNPSGEIKEGILVTLTCKSDAKPAAKYTWYKKNAKSHLHLLTEDAQLVFRSIQSSDSGEYYCTAENKLGRRRSEDIFIDVKYAPKLPSVSVSPSGEIVEGSSVTLNCSSDANPAANYTWYKENVNVKALNEEAQLVFRSIQSSDSGEYYCAAENELRRRTSGHISINVTYPPKLPSVSVSPSGDIMEGSSVTLSCSSDANPAANYTWYKENEDSPKASGQNFTITDIRAEHSGNYYCEAQNRGGSFNITLHLTVVADCTTPGNVFPGLPAQEQDDLQYASILFSSSRADALNSNIRPAQPLRHMEQQEPTEYAEVKYAR